MTKDAEHPAFIVELIEHVMSCAAVVKNLKIRSLTQRRGG
jgi:hypothetical protein